ncbi:MAG: hypothetical protein ACFFDF_25860 [Candidatus Odinarchaeota archaeon]
MKEFKINEHLTLKLEEGKTNIYVNGTLFHQCKFLLINTPIKEIDNLNDIKSIDDAAELLDLSLGNDIYKYDIPPEAEFWGHCSNLQVWYEYNYDLRLIHSNLAFPLLQRLTDAGDPLAAIRFKEELVKRLRKYPEMMPYYFFRGYIEYLTKEEIQELRQVQSLENVKKKKDAFESTMSLIENHMLKVGMLLGENIYYFIKDQIDTYKREELKRNSNST